MKRCSQCKESKSVADFYRDRSTYDGLSARCKPCAVAHSTKTAKQRRARGVRYSRSTEPRICTVCGVLCAADLFGTDKGRRSGLNPVCKPCRRPSKQPNRVAYTRKHRAKHPERKQARDAINKAVQRKLIPHPTTQACFVCRRTAAQYHHHQGYGWEYRYHVIPVCIDCHTHIDHGVYTVSTSEVPPVYVPRVFRR